MSKKELRKYLHSLDKEQLEEQLLDLYGRFNDVKVYYDFVFNPREDRLIEECKYKIRKEYFPAANRKAKARRSVAQRYIRHFNKLGMEPGLVADVMLFNLETATEYSARKKPRQEAFYISMLKSFREAGAFIREHGLGPAYTGRLHTIVERVWKQEWFNAPAFERV